MAKILLMISLAAASLAAKDRAWQSGQLLDKTLNPYFKITASVNSGKSDRGAPVVGDIAVEVNVHTSNDVAVYDDYVIESEDTVYMVEFAHFKTVKPPHLSLSRPLSFAVEKNKVWIKDLDGIEFDTQILKQVPKGGRGVMVASSQTAPAPAKPTPAPVKPAAQPQAAAPQPEIAKTAPPKAAPVNAAPVKAAPVKALAKPDPFALVSANTPAPKPAAIPVVPAPRPDPKPEAVVSKPPLKPEPAAKPAALKDRAWQSGQLLSIVNNSYFFNVTFSSDSEGSGWPFVQGSDGRYTVNGQIGNPTRSPYTYDNYVIESQFCVYLVQRMRPKVSPAVRLPGTAALRFAVEKNRLWVLDDEYVEYETKVVKLVQKATIVDPRTRAAAR